MEEGSLVRRQPRGKVSKVPKSSLLKDMSLKQSGKDPKGSHKADDNMRTKGKDQNNAHAGDDSESPPSDRIGYVKNLFTQIFVFIFSKTNAVWDWIFNNEEKGMFWPKVIVLALIIFIIVQSLYYVFSEVCETFRKKTAIGKKLYKLTKICDRLTDFLSGTKPPPPEEPICIPKKKNDPLYYHVVFLPSETQDVDDINPALRLISAAIDEAECSIDGCLFVITNPDLTSLLTEATGRNIKVRLIMDNEACKLKGNNEIDILKAAGVKCYVMNSPFLMHHKFLIIDGRITIISSFNWTKQGLEGNCENVLITNDPKLTIPYHREFMGVLKDVTEFMPKSDCPGLDMAEGIEELKKNKMYF